MTHEYLRPCIAALANELDETYITLSEDIDRDASGYLILDDVDPALAQALEIIGNAEIDLSRLVFKIKEGII
ncbi:hypothetical protein SAMN04488498_101412 [Mesorhizobium albiziae]|uniref:Uncharacterized protein n=1 Tax=Neomesorhizobium albiziae TaxID=335020 RepID=A0A1I3VET9_9HYPH|nr:hypothetical protein [Mesorhizobium albiziae]GLS28871.1 hypothetical protein GCM10007937_05780 [Mesorhizobium albiziae]SFJ93888.1 hypothetical protein SAMN04488498_101412 [Mesorhizobium albiziae]